MLATAVIAFLLGAAFAQRFKIHILIPLIGFAAAAILFEIVMSIADGWHLVLMLVTAAASLQIGYLAGAAFRTWEVFHLGEEPREAGKKMADNESLPIN